MSPATLAALQAFAARVSVRPDEPDFQALFIDEEAITLVEAVKQADGLPGEAAS